MILPAASSLLTLLVVLVQTAAAAGVRNPHPWPGLSHGVYENADQGWRASRESCVATAQLPPLSSMWRTTLGTGEPIAASPAISREGLIFVGTGLGAGAQGPLATLSALYSVHAANGSVAWTLPSGSPIVTSPTLGELDDRVYFASTAGVVTAANRTTGAVAWSKSMGGSSPVLGIVEFSASSTANFTSLATPFVVVAGGAGTLSALAAHNGSLLWQRNLTAPLSAEALTVFAPNGTIIVCTTDGYVRAFDHRGEPKWTTRFATEVLQPPAISASQDLVYLVASRSPGSSLRALSLATGVSVWERDTLLISPSPSTPTVYRNGMVALLDGPRLTVFYTTGLLSLSKSAVAAASGGTAPALGYEGYLVHGSSDGSVWMHILSNFVNPVQTIQVNVSGAGAITASPAIGPGGLIVVGSTNGVLVGLSCYGCPPGTAGIDCNMCPAGTFSRGFGAPCQLCPVNTSSSAVGLDSETGCVPCSPWLVSVASRTSCVGPSIAGLVSAHPNTSVFWDLIKDNSTLVNLLDSSEVRVMVVPFNSAFAPSVFPPATLARIASNSSLLWQFVAGHLFKTGIPIFQILRQQGYISRIALSGDLHSIAFSNPRLLDGKEGIYPLTTSLLTFSTVFGHPAALVPEELYIEEACASAFQSRSASIGAGEFSIEIHRDLVSLLVCVRDTSVLSRVVLAGNVTYSRARGNLEQAAVFGDYNGGLAIFAPRVVSNVPVVRGCLRFYPECNSPSVSVHGVGDVVFCGPSGIVFHKPTGAEVPDIPIGTRCG